MLEENTTNTISMLLLVFMITIIVGIASVGVQVQDISSFRQDVVHSVERYGGFNQEDIAELASSYRADMSVYVNVANYVTDWTPKQDPKDDVTEEEARAQTYQRIVASNAFPRLAELGLTPWLDFSAGKESTEYVVKTIRDEKSDTRLLTRIFYSAPSGIQKVNFGTNADFVLRTHLKPLFLEGLDMAIDSKGNATSMVR
jgi:hypothetical protein